MLLRPDIYQKKYVDNSVYLGQLQEDTRHGKGIYYFTNQNEIYFGDWEDNVQHGFGVYIFSNGEKYEGEIC